MKFFTSSLLMIALVAVGWHYLPQQTREKILGAIGIAARGDTQQVKHFVTDMVLPKDPRERRAALAGELEKNIGELRRRLVSGADEAVMSLADRMPPEASGRGDASRRVASTGDLIRTSEAIVKDLVSANKDTTVGGKITERILDTILPAPRAAEKCPIK